MIKIAWASHLGEKHFTRNLLCVRKGYQSTRPQANSSTKVSSQLVHTHTHAHIKTMLKTVKTQKVELEYFSFPYNADNTRKQRKQNYYTKINYAVFILAFKDWWD